MTSSKRMFFKTFLVCTAVLTLSATVAHAQSASESTCNEEQMQRMTERGQEQLERNHKVLNQTVTPPQPTGALTCLADQMAHMSNIGTIFSDAGSTKLGKSMLDNVKNFTLSALGPWLVKNVKFGDGFNFNMDLLGSVSKLLNLPTGGVSAPDCSNMSDFNDYVRGSVPQIKDFQGKTSNLLGGGQGG